MSNFTDRIQVLVRHRLPVVAAGMAAVLRQRPELEVHLSEPAGRVDVVVVDSEGSVGLMAECARHAGSQSRGQARVLVLADSDREAEVRAALHAGVHGYVLFDCGLDELVASVMALSRGSRYLCASVANRMAESMAYDTLTPRESDVLALMVKGSSNKLIARQLAIGPGTVKSHAKSVFSKLKVGTRLQAVAIAAQRGLVASHH
jgi:DNA-binding NarL/FixJ family response regulator